MDDRSSPSPGSGVPSAFAPPTLRGRHVSLRPVVPEDYPALRAAELSDELAVRWRFRGAPVSPERWVHAIWDGTFAQYLVISTRSSRPIGLVVAYNANLQDGHVYVGAVRFERHGRSPMMMIGTALFIDYIFTCWNFHKLYFEVPEFNLGPIESALGQLFSEEGRFRDHIWYAGRRWDQALLAVYRDRWSARVPRAVRAESAVASQQIRIRVPELPVR